ncbi:MAG: glutamate formimidoyltransferase [Chitinophagaceae bacterium]|nr:glutamate formimidoyltransferase [Chitinophagaceae bacterium]
MKKILECIPNFSEGNNTETLQKIAAAISAVPNVWLLHQDVSPAANRTVFTFAGEPNAVVEAAFRAIQVASENMDMRTQKGVHPRVGATDVCPFVPLVGMTMEEADACAQVLAKRVGTELQIPVYLYEHSQQQKHRKALPQIRKGQYEGIKEKMKLPEWQPDFGPKEMNEKAGATVIGARDILVAFNISLNSKDLKTAEWMAAEMRASAKSSHSLTKLRAIGWYMADYEQAQVSFNLLDYKTTSPLQVWNKCAALAKEKNVSLIGSEVIGLIPEACLLETGTFALMQKAESPTEKESIIAAAIQYLGLNKLKAFEPNEKILEWVLEYHSNK